MPKDNPAPAHPYQKLGGFLKCMVAIAIIIPLFNVVLLFSDTGFFRSWRGYEGAEFWLQLVRQLCMFYIIAMQLTFAVMVLRRDPRFLRTWQLVYIGTALSAAMSMVLRLMYGYPENTSFAYGLAMDIFYITQIPAGLGLFTLYYAKSVRVRTYMGTDEYLRLGFFTKKARAPEPAGLDGA